MKALITGINGQDGAYLAKLLQDKGYDVIGIMRKKEETYNLSYTGAKPRFYYGDISESEFINYVVWAEKPDEIYNLAAQSHVGYSFNSPITTMNVNYGGLVNIINAVKRFHPKAKIYQAGTSEMFGYAAKNKQDEDTPFNPMSPYAISKVAAHWAGVNARKEGIWVSNGILFNHESPIRGEDFVTRKITLAKAKGEKLELGDVSARRDWGFAGDFVEGMWLMLQHDKPDDFVLATGETHSVKEFIEAVGAEYTASPNFLRPNDLKYLCGDASKARDLLGWEPKVRFKQLVQLMLSEDIKRYGKKETIAA